VKTTELIAYLVVSCSS